APRLVRTKRRALVFAMQSKGCQIRAGVKELESPSLNPFGEECVGAPRGRGLEGGWREDRKLVEVPVGQVDPADLLAGRVVERERGQVREQTASQWLTGSAEEHQWHRVGNTCTRYDARDHGGLVAGAAE